MITKYAQGTLNGTPHANHTYNSSKQDGGVKIHDIIHQIKHYLPAQAPLKDFIHHNTLHAFQKDKFLAAIKKASVVFGYKVMLDLSAYRRLYHEKRISNTVLDAMLIREKGQQSHGVWKEKLLTERFQRDELPRIGSLRSVWKKKYKTDLDSRVHPVLFRTLCSYLDQGISIWNFPGANKGFLPALRDLESNGLTSLFFSRTAKQLLLSEHTTVEQLLNRIVGDKRLFEQYLYDQQFAHQGWSGMVSAIEDQPQTLLDQRKISLHDLILFELILEIDVLEQTFGADWKPISSRIEHPVDELFAPIQHNEKFEVLSLWHQAFEWSYYDQVLGGISTLKNKSRESGNHNFQALFCIDDRECSLRRYLEEYDPSCETFGTPGFFGVEFFFQPEDGKFYTKLCPAPVTPKYLIKEIKSNGKRSKDVHFTKYTHTILGGWLISQTIGFWSALKLALNVFRPTPGAATATSFSHMDPVAELTIEHTDSSQVENNLQIGFKIEEMAVRVENLLRSIGLVKDFAPIVYVVGHGSSSVNNPHYAAYDCGACSGRPGSVNARVLSRMANHPKVREILAERGIHIPSTTIFTGGLHDTTRDEIQFFDIDQLDQSHQIFHRQNESIFAKALDSNAKERSRRFESIDSTLTAQAIHDKIKVRSVSLFEPRPELNHATNALCIVGGRYLSRGLFLDRRSFLNSYDHRIDPEGNYLFNILKAAAPVCGGINLEYFFSRVDNQKLGAGTKLPHNVMGLFGVANGIDGDLRPGLPKQMIEVHDPVRLLIIVEHRPDVVLRTIQRAAETYEWFINDWVQLVVLDPETRHLYRFANGEFHSYEPLQHPEYVANLKSLIESTQENFPVYLIQK